jgi:spermidine/putrescine-binding protein
MSRFLLSLSAAALFAGAVHADEVRVYNWSDYIDESAAGKVRGRDRLST